MVKRRMDTGDEGYFERLHQEAASLREAADPFTKTFMAKLKLIDLSSGQRDDFQEVADCPELTICYLHSNLLSKIDHVDRCAQLRKMDVHGNKLETLPGPAFWSHLVNLEVLHLHTNNLQNLDDAHGLAVLPSLTVLSLYRNPIALHPFYRSQIVSAMASTLRVLDHFALSVEEVIDSVEAAKRGYTFGEILARSAGTCGSSRWHRSHHDTSNMSIVSMWRLPRRGG